MSWVSKDAFLIDIWMVHWFHVVSVERCIFNRYMNGTLISCHECRKIHFNRYMNGTMLLKYMSWVLKDAFLIDIWMVHWFHVVSVERCIFNRYMNGTLISCRECRKIHFNRYMNGTMLFKVHVVSVERCIFNRYMNLNHFVPFIGSNSVCLQ